MGMREIISTLMEAIALKYICLTECKRLPFTYFAADFYNILRCNKTLFDCSKLFEQGNMNIIKARFSALILDKSEKSKSKSKPLNQINTQLITSWNDT